MEGKWYRYHSNGRIFRELEYKDGSIVDGLYTEYHCNGAVRKKEKYYRGSLVDGTYIVCDLNGDICEIQEYRNKQVRQILKIEGSKIAAVDRYKDGYKVNTRTDSHKNTKLENSKKLIEEKEIEVQDLSSFDTIIY